MDVSRSSGKITDSSIISKETEDSMSFENLDEKKIN